jgi:hypothetical protein
MHSHFLDAEWGEEGRSECQGVSGASWGRLGGVFEASLGVSGRLRGAFVGCMWGVLGRLGGILEHSLAQQKLNKTAVKR